MSELQIFNNTVDELLNDLDMLIAALTKLKAKRKKTNVLMATVAVQNQQIVEMKLESQLLQCST